MYGHVWSYRLIYEYMGQYVVIHVYTWQHIIIFCHIWPYSPIHRHVWPCMAMHSFIRQYIITYDHLWPYTNIYMAILWCMVIYDHIWLFMAIHINFLIDPSAHWSQCRPDLMLTWFGKEVCDTSARCRTRPDLTSERCGKTILAHGVDLGSSHAWCRSNVRKPFCILFRCQVRAKWYWHVDPIWRS